MARLVLSVIEIRRLRQALALAIDYQASLIDAHRTALIRRRGLMERYIPPENRGEARRLARDIEAFRRIRRKLQNGDAR